MKKLLSMLLCLCLMISILPTNVFAANITIFNVTVQEPKVGEELSYKASVPETASTYVTKVEWDGEYDALGKIKPGKYTVKVTVRIKDGMDDKYIKKPSKDTVKVNGNIATIGEITADKKQAVITYTFTVSGQHEDVKGQEIVNTESNLLPGSSAMQSSTVAAVRSAALANAEPNTPFAEEPQELRDVIPFMVTVPTAGVKHDGKVTTSHPDIEITSITWAGQVDKNGVYIVGNHYDLVVAFKIKGTVNKKLAANIKYKKTTVNGEELSYNVSQVSERAGYIMKTFEVQPPKPVVDIKNVFTQAQADERWVTVNPMYPSEIIVKDDRTLSDIVSSYNLEQLYCVKKIVFNRSYDEEYQEYYDAIKSNSFPNLEEVWLGSNVDVKHFIDSFAEVRFGLTGDEWEMALDASNWDSQKLTMFVSDAKVKGFGETIYDSPEGYLVFNHDLYKRFNTRLYSGDVMDAYKKGASAGYEWCTKHEYIDAIYTPDRVYTMKNCNGPIRYYYSCSKCGKCEYDPNHTQLVNPNFTFHWNRMRADPCVSERNLSDKYFLGFNSRGERVYWKSCVMCGKIHNDDLLPSEGMILPEHALEGSSIKEDSVGAFAVRADRYVTAKMSEWAQNEVQWASQNGILDTSLLGNDFTKPITRLQFASIAVKLAEVLTGNSITPAPQGTFADTDNEYALKAYASGITSGVSATEFAPNGTLTRQQMATFIYRALMYVRDNTNIRYTTYTPSLENYSDNWAIQDWARTSLGFMNALGLVKGVSDTAIDPDGKCTIEQAALVANRSVNADQIGWYQVPLSTEKDLSVGGKGSCPYYYAPTPLAPTQTRYRNSERIWVDAPTSGGQKASENPDWSALTNYLITVDPFTGERAYVLKQDFRPIKDLKNTDVADYNQYYSK